MKVRFAVYCLLLALTVAGFANNASAQAKPVENPTVASVLDHQFSGVEAELVPAAEAMPADKYSFAPSQGEFKGVRNFGQQVKHVAWANYRFFGDILGQKLEAQAGMNGPDSVQTKDEILKYLRNSFALGHTAIATITAENLVTRVPNPRFDFMSTRLALVVVACRHAFDIYGQMVIYLRMNGIVPPASRE